MDKDKIHRLSEDNDCEVVNLDSDTRLVHAINLAIHGYYDIFGSLKGNPWDTFAYLQWGTITDGNGCKYSSSMSSWC